VRIAGNTVTRAGLESIDYAVTHLGTNLIMVLGHDKCGAVKGAVGKCSSKPDAGLPEIFANICPAVDLARKKNADDLESRAIDLNVTEQVKVLKQSPLFKEHVADAALRSLAPATTCRAVKSRFLTPVTEPGKRMQYWRADRRGEIANPSLERTASARA
jgi:carbonic anhydrase